MATTYKEQMIGTLDFADGATKANYAGALALNAMLGDPCYADGPAHNIQLKAGEWKAMLLTPKASPEFPTGLMLWHKDSHTTRRPSMSKCGAVRWMLDCDSGMMALLPRKKFDPDSEEWYKAIEETAKPAGEVHGGLVVRINTEGGTFKVRGVVEDGKILKCLFLEFGSPPVTVAEKAMLAPEGESEEEEEENEDEDEDDEGDDDESDEDE